MKSCHDIIIHVPL